MAWSEEARLASIEARKRNAQANDVAHQRGVGAVGQPSSMSQRVLETIRNSPEGASINVRGETPTKGYMVAHEGRTKFLSDDDIKGPHAQAMLDEYAKRNSDVLNRKGAHIGVWRDPDSGKTHLDVADNVRRRTHAVRAGKGRNQISVYDVKRRRTIDTGGSGD